MPGSRQLKQFSSDLLAIGDEVTIRASRGEKPVRIPIPKEITIEDDSEDFVLGMPINEAVEVEEQVEEDLSDLAGLATPQTNKAESAEPVANFDAPDLSSLLNPINVADDASAGSEMPDLSMFMEPEEVEEEVVEEEPEEVSIADMGLEALLAGTGFDEPEEPEQSGDDFDDYMPDMAATEDVASIDDIDEIDELSDVNNSNKDPIADIDADLAAILGDDNATVNDSSTLEDSDTYGDIDESLFANTPENENTANDVYAGIDIDNLDGLDNLDSADADLGNIGLDDIDLGDSNLNSTDIGDIDFGDSGLDSADLNIDGLNSDDLSMGTEDFGNVENYGDIDDLGGLEELSDIDLDTAVDELTGDDDNTDESNEVASELISGIDDLVDDVLDTDNADNGSEDLGSLDDVENLNDDFSDVFAENTNDISDFDMPDLGDISDIDNVENIEDPENLEPEDNIENAEKIGNAENIEAADDLNAPVDFGDIGDVVDLGDIEDVGNEPEDLSDSVDFGDIDDLSDTVDISDIGGIDDLENNDDIDNLDLPGDTENLDETGDLSGDIDFNLDDVNVDSFDLPEDAGTLNAENTDADGLSDLADVDLDGLAAGDLDQLNDDLSSDDISNTDGLDNLGGAIDSIDIDDLDGSVADLDAPEVGELDSTDSTDAADDGFDISDIDLDNPEDSMTSAAEDFASGVPEGLFDQNDMEMPEDLGAGDDFGSMNLDDMDSVTDFGADSLSDAGSDVDFDEDNFGENLDEETPEIFDTSEMDGMDFDMPETDAQMGAGGDFDLGNGDDFALEGDFEIPGFSDVETIKEDKKGSKSSPAKEKGKRGKKGKSENDVDEADFSQAMESEELPPNTLSDAQYKEFLKNLSEYPLNVRLAVEDLLVKDEFTEDAEFEIVEKILNKVPARQLAGTLEKMLDTSIPVPRDFEHRTAEEYEAYKKSLSYQLRNKIIPGAIAFVALVLVAWGLFNFSKNCIYKPLKANSLYKQGYNLILENEYPQSEMKFTEATKYKLSKKWFFEYARGYREHKQYQRAGKMYKNILYCFKHDKEAGLEYAAMELEDLANYERAEEIIKREVLDYHINDADGILLLGDNYLEWGTEKDPEKLELARQQYATLMQLYKPNELYLSRMMRYFIRSDKLLNVLQIKDTFQKDKSLEPEDWTELSGYLLDKFYGPLAPADEYLRYQIEGLRGSLLRAVKNDSDNPVAFYNLGRYYVLSNELAGIESALQKAIKKFNTSESLKRRDIYKYIDSYRLLGEYYTGTTDYLQAQEQFTEGISLYTTERDNAGFEGNAQVGKLFEDLANIKYFVSGDYDEALLNYKNSVELNNDTPSIRYKIGYIQYKNKNYIEALGSFMKAGDGNIKEPNLMLAMANTLSMRGDDYTAQGYYERLINKLDLEVAEKGLVLPQKNITDNDLVTSYMYASNNYGVTLYHLAKRTGNSSLNAQAIVQFQQSLRAWDALTRNQDSLLRLPGSNLAEQNIQYITHRLPDFEPSIYINIPNTLTDKEHL